MMEEKKKTGGPRKTGTRRPATHAKGPTGSRICEDRRGTAQRFRTNAKGYRVPEGRGMGPRTGMISWCSPKYSSKGIHAHLDLE